MEHTKLVSLGLPVLVASATGAGITLSNKYPYLKIIEVHFYDSESKTEK